MKTPLKAATIAVGAAPPEPDPSFRLHIDEPVADGVRRVARGQLDGARLQLDGASERTLGEAVHETRKTLKRLRACVRLTRDAAGEKIYRGENEAFRDAARQLAAGRDAEVLLATLDDVCARFGDELQPSTLKQLRARLQREHERAAAALRGDDGDGVAAVREALEQARMRTADWRLQCDGFDALAPGLQRIYRRGRRRMRAACADPSDENLHEWRKRVKDLWHASELVCCAHPKRMKRFARRAHKLADDLGDAHDLSMLREYVASHPESFDDDEAAAALLAVIDRRAGKLRERALKRGRRLYKRKPRRFVREMDRAWRKRTAAAARG